MSFFACITYRVKGAADSHRSRRPNDSVPATNHSDSICIAECWRMRTCWTDCRPSAVVCCVFFGEPFFLLSFSNEWTNSTDGPKRAYTPLYGCWRAAASLNMSFSFLLSIREPARAAGPWCRAKTGIVSISTPPLWFSAGRAARRWQLRSKATEHRTYYSH
jgi:hypothetical protein